MAGCTSGSPPSRRSTGAEAVKIAVAQIHLAESLPANKDRILQALEEAARREVDILAFPETALSGYLFEGFLAVDAAEVEGALREIGTRLKGGKLHVIVGTPFREGGALHNSAAVLFPDGRRLLYHKIHLVSYEREYFQPGGRKLTFEVQGARFGVMICRDQNAPELARELKEAGARGVFICSAHYYEPVESRMKVEKNIALPIARAYENNMYVFKSNAVGTLKRLVSYGNSLIVDPRGIVVQRAGETREELLVYDIDFGKDNPSW